MEIHENSQHSSPFKVPTKVEPELVITLRTEPSDFAEPKLENRKKKTSSETFGCLICHAVFGRRDHLRRHNKTVHCADKKHICHLCNLDFLARDLLIQHLSNTHPDESQFICAECQYIADDLQALVTHKKVHVVNKHVCPYCEACFKRQDHMNRHVKSLHLKQHVTCEVCKQIFKRQDHLQRHMREQHGIFDRKRLCRK